MECGLTFEFTRGPQAAKPLVERRVQRRVSEVIGPLPQIAPKKHVCLRYGNVECGAAEDRCSNGAICPRVSVVMGNVIDIGESAGRYRAAGPISRLRE